MELKASEIPLIGKFVSLSLIGEEGYKEDENLLEKNTKTSFTLYI